MKQVVQALKTHLAKPDPVKWAILEGEIISSFPRATKDEYIELSREVAKTKLGSEELWETIQKEYLRRYDHFNVKDTRNLYEVFHSCPYDVTDEVESKYIASCNYIVRQYFNEKNKKDPTYEKRVYAMFQGLWALQLGYVPPAPGTDMLKWNNDLQAGLRERQPTDIEEELKREIELEEQKNKTTASTATQTEETKKKSIGSQTQN